MGAISGGYNKFPSPLTGRSRYGVYQIRLHRRRRRGRADQERHLGIQPVSDNGEFIDLHASRMVSLLPQNLSSNGRASQKNPVESKEAPPGTAAVIFRVPVKIELQRACRGLRLLDDAHTARRGGEEIGHCPRVVNRFPVPLVQRFSDTSVGGLHLSLVSPEVDY
jgi:hypothetical protein